MLHTIAIKNYRSLLDVTLPLSDLNVITGPNASGKSNLYRAIRLLAETAQGGVVNALAKEGGLNSTYWAGPEKITNRMLSGEVPVQSGPKQDRTRLKLGFAGDTFGYSISLGLPTPSSSAFSLDPEIKKESIWAGHAYRPASVLVERNGPVVRAKVDGRWEVLTQHASSFESLFAYSQTPETFALREEIRNWRFYDHFRTDTDAPARQSQLGTRTPALHHDGHDLASAFQTIREIGDNEALNAAIEDAFPGMRLKVDVQGGGRFGLEIHQEGLLRPLSGMELSDGTLRYLLLVAALMTPRPPPLMVLNEPETSLHPDLLPSLGRLIVNASKHTQIWIVSHSSRLVAALEEAQECNSLGLEKVLGQTKVVDQGILDQPMWRWPDQKSSP